MLFMSFFLTSLSRTIKQSVPAVVIRFLADYLLVTYVGEQLCVIIQAFNRILEYLHDIGGKVAPKKALCFSTVPDFRSTLRAHIWEPIKARIPLVSSFRDLVAHLNIAINANGATLTNRLREASPCGSPIRFLPHSSKKCQFVKCKMLGKGIYGGREHTR